jgi:hypothetical protein
MLNCKYYLHILEINACGSSFKRWSRGLGPYIQEEIVTDELEMQITRGDSDR